MATSNYIECSHNINMKEKMVSYLFIVSCVFFEIAPDSLYNIIPNIGIYVVFGLVPILVLLGQSMIDKNKHNVLFKYIFACSVFFLYVFLSHFELPLVSNICYCIFTGCFIALKPRYREWIFYKFVRVNAVLLSAGMIEYILALLGVHYFWGVYEKGGVYFYQGIFMSIPSYMGITSTRFMAFFDEPGYLGTLSFFVLIVLDYTKYKKEYFIYLIAGILSFSLAFYALYFAWLLIDNTSVRNFMKKFLPVAALFVMISIPFASYLNDRIIERVSGRDIISEVDNRSSDEVNKKFEKFITSSDALWGLGEREFYEWKRKTGNTCVGLKYVLFQDGIVGLTMMFLIFNLFFLRYNGYNRLSYKKLVFYWISFYQRAYWFYPPLVVLLFKDHDK